jgi:hypothetical protein
MFKHNILYYHKDGYVEIQLQLQQNGDNSVKNNKVGGQARGMGRHNNMKEETFGSMNKDRSKGTGGSFKHDILMSGFCNKCQSIIAPEVVMSS